MKKIEYTRLSNFNEHATMEPKRTHTYSREINGLNTFSVCAKKVFFSRDSCDKL